MEYKNIFKFIVFSLIATVEIFYFVILYAYDKHFHDNKTSKTECDFWLRIIFKILLVVQLIKALFWISDVRSVIKSFNEDKLVLKKILLGKLLQFFKVVILFTLIKVNEECDSKYSQLEFDTDIKQNFFIFCLITGTIEIFLK